MINIVSLKQKKNFKQKKQLETELTDPFILKFTWKTSAFGVDVEKPPLRSPRVAWKNRRP